MPPNQTLWLTRERREFARQAAGESAPWIVPLCARAAEPAEETHGIVRRAVRAMLAGETASPAVRDWALLVEAGSAAQDLSKAHLAVTGAVVVDCLREGWAADDQGRMVSGLAGILTALLQVSSGNPHAVGNNWWGVTHSGFYCASAALAAIEPDRLVAGRTATEWEEWSWGRLRAFLGHFGPGGAYHEGLGYESYTCAYLLPAVLLRVNRAGESPDAVAPGLSRLAALLYAAALEGPVLSDETSRREGWGRMLSWNDAGLGWPEGPAGFLAAVLAPEDQRATYGKLWDRLAGRARPDRAVDEAHGSLFFQVAYRRDLGGSAPVPHQVCDVLHGLWIARNRREDARDAVAGASARGVHFGGHGQQDAGSIRFSALGWDWVLGGGQARGDALWQSRLVPTDHDPHHAACGAALWSPGDNDPSVFGMDLRSVHRGYSERYVALRPAPESHLAVLDVVDDHRSDRAWDWALTFSPELSCETFVDSFRLIAPDGAEMEAVFLLDRPVSMEVRWMPGSQRTYASGVTRGYAARPFLVARFAGPSLNIYTSLRVTPARSSRVALVAPGSFDLRAEGGIWANPFSPALPGTFSGRLAGFCRRPA